MKRRATRARPNLNEAVADSGPENSTTMGVAERLRAVVEQIASERIFCSALQVSLRSEHLDVDVVAGELARGIPIQVPTVFSVVCASKPIVAVALGHLIDSGDIDPSKPVAQVWAGDPPSCYDSLNASTWDILSHSADLASPRLLEMQLCPLAERVDLLRRGVEAQAVGYSECSSQYVLAKLIQAVAGVCAAEYVNETVLRPLQLTSDIRFEFNEVELAESDEQIGFAVLGLPISEVPLLHDRSPFQACDDRVLLGAYCSARGLCKFYDSVGRAMAGASIPGIPSEETMHAMFHQPSATRIDPILQREGRFAGGFMLDLCQQGYGRVSDRAFGHTGFNGMSWGFFDPTHRIAMSGIGNGHVPSQSDVDFLRSRIINSVIPVSEAE